MIEAVLKRGALPDATRRGCHDCRMNMAAVSWWCTSEPARADRGTKLPTVGSGCPHWVPCRTEDEVGLLERVIGGHLVISGESP